MANLDTWREPIVSAPNDIASNLRNLVLYMATFTPDAMQVDVANNYDASDRLSRGLKEVKVQLDTIQQDLNKKRYQMRQRNEKMGSVDEDGEGKDFDINK